MRNIEGVLSWLAGEARKRLDVVLPRAEEDEAAEGYKLGVVIIGVAVNLRDVDRVRKEIRAGAAEGDVGLECGVTTTLPSEMVPLVLSAVSAHIKAGGRFK